MFKRLSSVLGWSADEDKAAGLPFYLFLTLLVAALYAVVVRSDSYLRDAGQRLLFSALMLAHLVLHWFSARLAQAAKAGSRRLPLIAYCVLQAAIIVAVSFLTSHLTLVMALYAALAGQTVGMLWPEWRAVVLSALLYVALLALNVVLIWGPQQLAITLPAIGGMLAFTFLYVVLYIRQVQAREDAQRLLGELEDAHRQLQAYADRVEELSVSQERHRMARELHDTLAQGLVGLVLQLEAADSHLSAGSPARAQTVVRQALQRAKSTLGEARRAIQDLRPPTLEEDTLVAALGRELDAFSSTTGVRSTFEVAAGAWDLEPEMAQDILRIMQEALSNVARHAAASHVLIRLDRRDGRLVALVRDDGTGFDVQEGSGRQGCFGLVGMRERAERWGGALRVTSAPGEGTELVLELEE